MYYRLPEPAREELAGRPAADKRLDPGPQSQRHGPDSSTTRLEIQVQSVIENKTEATVLGSTPISFVEVTKKRDEFLAI
ncbi:hypothetical protein J6590_065979 [Homalodisca vitripennis]|nr:hypothetical protein J6590_065979 [Homalodisca vitripennis]